MESSWQAIVNVKIAKTDNEESILEALQQYQQITAEDLSMYQAMRTMEASLETTSKVQWNMKIS